MAEDNKGTRNNPLFTHIVGNENTAWARESTLSALLDATGGTNSLLAEYIKKEYPKLAKKANDIANATHKTTSSKLDALDRTAQQNNKNFKNIHDDLNENFSGLKTNLNQSINRISGLLKAEDPTKNIAENIKDGLTGVGKPMGEAIGTIISPGIGTAIGSVVGPAIMGVIGELPIRGLELGKIFRDLYDSGLAYNGSMDEMLKSATDLRITSDQQAAIFKKHTDSIAGFGTPNIVKFSKQLSNLTNKGSELGYTYNELIEAGLEYSDLIVKEGSARSHSTEELAAGAQKYLQELTGLSELTGKSRKQLAQEQKDIASQAKVRAGSRLLQNKEDKERFGELKKITGPVGDFMRARFLELHGVTGAMTDAQRTMLLTMGDGANKLDESLTSAAQGTQFLTQAYGTATTALTEDAINPVVSQATAMDKGPANLKAAGELFNDIETQLTTSTMKLTEEMNKSGISMSAAMDKFFTVQPDDKSKKTMLAQSDIEQTMADVKNKFDSVAVESVPAFRDAIVGAVEKFHQLGDGIDKLGDSINTAIEKMTGVKTGVSNTAMGSAAVAAGGTALGLGAYSTAGKVGQILTARSATLASLMGAGSGTTGAGAGAAGSGAGAGTGAAGAGATASRLSVLGRLGYGAALGGGLSYGIGKLATGTETGRGIGKWIGENVPGAKSLAEGMKSVRNTMGLGSTVAKPPETEQKNTSTNVTTQAQPNPIKVAEEEVWTTLIQSINILTDSNFGVLKSVLALNGTLTKTLDSSMKSVQAAASQTSEMQTYGDAIQSLAIEQRTGMSVMTDAQRTMLLQKDPEVIANSLKGFFEQNNMAYEESSQKMETIANAIRSQKDDYNYNLEAIKAVTGQDYSRANEVNLQGVQAYAPILANAISTQIIKSTEAAKPAEAPNTAEQQEQVPVRQTKEFYERTLLASESMVTVLKEMLDKLNELNQNVTDQTNELDRSINSISGVIH